MSFFCAPELTERELSVLRCVAAGQAIPSLACKLSTRPIQANAIAAEVPACFSPGSFVVFSNCLNLSAIACSLSAIFRSLARSSVVILGRSLRLHLRTLITCLDGLQRLFIRRRNAYGPIRRGGGKTANWAAARGLRRKWAGGRRNGYASI